MAMADYSPECGASVALSLSPQAGDQQEADASPDEAPKGAEYSVRVAIRVRPPLPQEQHDVRRECLSVQSQHKQIVVGKDTYTFDQVFGPDAPQERIHEEAAWPLIEGLGQGLNATLLAYGQTSAGKTYTLGSCHNAAIPEEQHGVIPRFVNALFRDLVYPRQKDADTTIRVSFVELHNEDINDLLDLGFVDKARGVLIREDPNHGVVVLGMKEVEVRKPTELLRCLEKGAMLRTTASTQLNEQSSRSHAIFTVSLEQTFHAKGETLSAKVRFADLAGSERAKKSGTVGERFREGVSINQGLLALGNVISALGDPKLNRSHVPYRDSKLTRMLQDSLGGNSRTLMIACVSPAATHLAETLNTLKYANRAKNIKNKVVVNVNVKDSEVAKLKEKIQELQSELFTARQQQSICSSLDCADNAVEEMTKHLFDLRGSNERLDQDNRRLRLELVATEQSLHQAAKDALDFRVKYEQCAMQIPAAPEAPADVPLQPEAAATADSGSTADSGHSDVVQTTLERYVQKIQDLQHRNRKLERFLADRESSRDRDLCPLRGLEQAMGASGSAAREGKDPTNQDEEDEEDAREERRHLSSQRELGTEVQELDTIIQDKEALMERLMKQNKVFNSMRENYELRLQQLQEAVEHATEEKEQTLKDMQQMQHEEGATKRKALLEGRLRELSRQLVELKRRQAEAQRLLRVKEQQEAQISRMHDEIGRLKGQKEVVESRMKYDEQQYRLWKKRWLARVREATRHSAQLQRQNNLQGRKLIQKTKEADQSARKVEELRREQKQYLDLARQRVQVEREAARAAKVREANARLKRELEARQRKVEQMEAMLSERMRLEGLGSERLNELKEVEEQIESLDAQIDFDSECIMQSQTQILKLTVPEPPAPEAPLAESTKGASEESAGPDSASGSSVVAQLRTLEEARSTCMACFQSIDELQAERSQLQGRVSELEADLANRESQIVELQARERLAETQWVEQANALQRLHLDKEVYLLGRVDRNLAEKHDLAELPEDSAAAEQPPPAASPAANTQAMLELLECRRQQIEALGQETEMLHRQVEHAALACNAAEEVANEAQEKLSKAESRARGAERRAEEAEQRLSQAQAEAAAPSPVPAPTAPAAHLSFAPIPRFGREPPSQENLDSGVGVEAWRSILVGEEGNPAALEDIAHRTGEQLRNIWTDLGISADAQRMHLQSLTEHVLHLCLQELRIHEQDRARLQSEHDAFEGVVACHNIQVADGPLADGSNVADTLHTRHTALRCAAQRKLDEVTEMLRIDLKDLFGLPQSVDASGAASQLKLLAKCGAQCFPGRVNVHVPTPLDLELLGLGTKGPEAVSLQQPTAEAFAAIAERQSQVASLLNETSAELRRVDAELRRYFESFEDGGQRKEAFIVSRGFGLPALAATRRELQQQQHNVRLRIADAQLRMTEQWTELGVSTADQERVLQGLRVSAQQGALEELQALTEETTRLESKIEGRRDILRRVKACTDLEGLIQDFERDASDSMRLRGSSKKLLEEEQQRLRFRKKKARLMEDLLARITEWEAENGERFLHKGVAIREALQQDLEDTKELGGLTLAQPAQASTPMGLAAHSDDSAASLASVSAQSAGSGPPSSAVPMATGFGLRSLRTARFEAVSTRNAVAAAAASPVSAPAGAADWKRRPQTTLVPPRLGGGSGNSPRPRADSGSTSPRPRGGGVVRSQEALGFGT